MAKSVILSNGNLNIGLNDHGLVSDFYFPDNAYENHTLDQNMFHKIGVRVDNKLSWLDDEGWKFSFEYFEDGLISRTTAINQSLQIKLESKDAVLYDKDALLRAVKVTNLVDYNREVAIFFHQNFSINSSKHLADTAQFIPDHPAILHYRGKRAFVVAAQILSQVSSTHHEWQSFDQHTVGLFGIENKEGSWRDAEDGELAGSNVEHGQTDSVIRFKTNLEPHQVAQIQYSIACADDHELAFAISNKVSGWLFQKELENTHRLWQDWLKPAHKFAQKLDHKYQKSFVQSLMVSKSHLSHTGAPIASNDSEMLNHARDDYSYCWPRDALFALWPFVRLGYDQELIKFFEFCENIMKPEGFLMHKYLPNGELGPSWHPYTQYNGDKNLPIQADETAGIIFLVAQFYNKFHNTELLKRFYKSLVKPMSDFLVEFTREDGLPIVNYELWEMYFLSSTYTTSIVYAALNSAAELARELGKAKDALKWQAAAEKMQITARKELFNTDRGYFYRGILPDESKDQTIDTSSLYGAFIFGLFDFDSYEVQQSLRTLEERFDVDQNTGVPRFENDVYYRQNNDVDGNYWIITTLWRAEFYIASGDIEKAKSIIDWVLDRASSTNILPEQIDPENLNWHSVAPLTWSQAEWASALLDLIAADE